MLGKSMTVQKINAGMSMPWLHRTGKLIAEERDRRNLFNYRT